jgi:DNA-binding SARP family transcriptional activator
VIRRILEVARGLAALFVVVALLGAVPLVLLRVSGAPASGFAHVLTDHLASDGARTEQLMGAALGLIAWACWAQLAYAVVVEAVAAARGMSARRAPVLPGLQTLAARLVATCVMATGALVPPVPAMAAPLMPALDHAPVSVVASPFPAVDGSPIMADRQVVRAPIQTYVVRDRDTYWDLAERFLGDGLRWRDLRTANLGQLMIDGTRITETTDVLHPGWELWLPPDAVAPLVNHAAEPTPLAGDHLVTVERGEHMWGLAKDALAEAWGREPTELELAPYWAQMVELNRDRLAPPGDPSVIYAGQELMLPPVPHDLQTTSAARPSEPTVAWPVSQPAPPSQPVQSTSAAPSTTPSTTASDRPTTTQVARSIEPTRPTEPSDVASDREPGLLALGFGGLATAAGALALVLRRNRQHQAARRRPGTEPVVPSTDALDYEVATRAIADADAARWIDATNRFLSNQLALDVTAPLPVVIAMRAGALGVEILLDEPCRTIEGFVEDRPGSSAWLVDPALELLEVERDGADAQPYCPSLVPVGRTEAGDLHVDLEQLGIVAVEGRPEVVHGWMRTLAIAMAVAPNARFCDVVALGLDAALGDLPFVTRPSDPVLWVNGFCAAMHGLNERLAASPYEQRVRPGEVFHPTVVFVSAEHAEAARHLADVAALINAPLAVVAAAPLLFGHRVLLTEHEGTLEPLGLAFVPSITSIREAEHAVELLGVTTAFDVAIASDAGDCDPQLQEPAEGSDEVVADVIERVLRKRPIEVSLLGPRPRIRGLGKEPAAKAASAIAYLAFHRDVSSQRLRETFWPSSTSRKTADNALSIVRQLLGVGADGQHRLTVATNTGRYEVSDDVGCDWTKAATLVQAARARSDGDAVELLRSALELVGGRIASDADRSFAWLSDDHEVYGRIERTMVDAAERLGELALAGGDYDLARWAADRGLAVVPGQEALLRMQMRAAAMAGDSQGVIDAYRVAVAAAEELGPWSEVQPETGALLRELLDHRSSPGCIVNRR